ncbi:MAG: hypothetical protein IJQ34_07920 [Kiritimatiellae bacterium]|nr:hypothetical protein [Kiritimatiellia bacterium]
MKRMIKVGITALAISAIAPVYAQQADVEAEEVEETEGSVGWTPIAIGLATPVQLPWGINKWDVYGLDFNLFYSDAPKMYGLDFGGFATVVRQDTLGVVIGGLFNGGFGDVYGLRATIGANFCSQTVYGAEFGLVGIRDKIYGVDANLLGSAQHNVCGFQMAGLANLTDVESYGCTVAGGANIARTAYGLQLAIFFNMTQELHGAQVALVNFADYCPNGFQIGLINIILSNQWKVLPFVNGYF